MRKNDLLLQKTLYWMLELRESWVHENREETADYGQLLEDIEEVEKVVNPKVLRALEVLDENG